MKGYKAFHSGWRCRDFQYKIGETYELPEGQELKICRSGFHFCKNPVDVYGYYDNCDDTVIAEVEALGEIQNIGTKYCTDKIKIVAEFPAERLQEMIEENVNANIGCRNTGLFNTGDDNSGDFNTGGYNSGDFNTGDYNSGSRNTGHCNSGRHNTGIRNIGNGNSGNGNEGNSNTGSHNTGDWNSGDYNYGDCNSGSYNNGNRNAGFYNTGNNNSGLFNTNEPEMRAFNKPTEMIFSQFIASLDYNFFGLCRRIKERNLIEGDEERIKALPNFDAEIFKEITGVAIS